MRLNFMLAALITMSFAGCGGAGPNLAEVEGTLKLRGQPWPEMVVRFVPDAEEGAVGPCSVAITDQNGHYELVCENKLKPGALVGKHAVLVYDVPPGPPGMDSKEKQAAPRKAASILERRAKAKAKKTENYDAAKYMAVARTPLHVEVKPDGRQVIDLNVE